MLEPQLFKLLERTADAGYSVTAAGEICSWNGAAERLFGYSAAEVLGRNVQEILKARDVLDTQALAGGADAATRRWKANADAIPHFDLQVRTKAGKQIWVNVSTIVYDNPRTGRRLFVRLVRDIDQRRRHEELLGRLVDAVLTGEPEGEQPHRILEQALARLKILSTWKKTTLEPEELRMLALLEQQRQRGREEALHAALASLCGEQGLDLAHFRDYRENIELAVRTLPSPTFTPAR